jgi:ribosomal protein L37AE/L43A
MSLGVETAPKAQGVIVITKPKCPACGANQAYYRKRTKDWSCKSCGHEFKEEPKGKKK